MLFRSRMALEFYTMPKHLILEECKTLLWFPDDPHFNQWMTRGGLADYGLTWSYPGHHDITGADVEHILVNWSNRTNVYAFQILHSLIDKMSFYTSEPFKFLKSQMDGITMKGGFLMIDKPEDVVMFRLIYGDKF